MRSEFASPSSKTRFLGFLVVFPLSLIIAWGETVGVVHAFRQHGVGDGFATIFVPPLAWWRGLEFFWHSDTQEASSAQKSREWPAPTPDELSVMSEATAKALHGSLSDSDLSRLKESFRAYTRRVGRSMSRQDLDQFSQVLRLPYEYNRELGQCLLYSLDTRQPVISQDLRRLCPLMKRNGTHQGKLDADIEKIISAAEGREWTDEFDRKHRALTREDVLAGLQELEASRENFEKLTKALAEVSAEFR